MSTALALVHPEKKDETPEETSLSMEEFKEMKEEMSRQFHRSSIDYITDKVDLNSLTKNINYALQSDGIYAIIKNRIGKFVLRSATADLPGLPKQFDAEAKIFLDLPKIPGEIYYQIKQFFTDIMTDMNDAEAFVQVYYDLYEDKYVSHVPEQEVSKASVEYDGTKNLDVVDRDRYILAFEVHSHNSMSAFWSGTDNSDEKETRFYGVFGNLDKAEYTEKFRTNVLGKYIDLKKEHIFNFTDKLNKSVILELLEKEEGDEVDPAALIEVLRAKPKADYPSDWIKNVNKPRWNGYPNTGSNHWKNRNTSGSTSAYDDHDGWDPASWGNGHAPSQKTWQSSMHSNTGTRGGNWSGGLPTNYNNLSKKEKKSSENNIGSGVGSGAHSSRMRDDDYQDDYDRYWGTKMDDFEGKYMGKEADPIVDPEAAAMEAYITKEIEDRFNFDTVEGGFEELACQEFARTLCPNHIYDLMDSLVEHGFQDEIFQYFGVTYEEEPEAETKPNKKAGKNK